MASTPTRPSRGLDAELAFHFTPPPPPRRSAPPPGARRKANHPIRALIVVAALVCGGSLAYTINAGASSDAQARRQARIERQLAQMQAALNQAATRDAALAAENARLVRRYNLLVRTTRAQLHAVALRKERAASLAILQLVSAQPPTSAAAASRVIAVASSPALVTQTS